MNKNHLLVRVSQPNIFHFLIYFKFKENEDTSEIEVRVKTKSDRGLVLWDTSITLVPKK